MAFISFSMAIFCCASNGTTRISVQAIFHFHTPRPTHLTITKTKTLTITLNTHLFYSHAHTHTFPMPSLCFIPFLSAAHSLCNALCMLCSKTLPLKCRFSSHNAQTRNTLCSFSSCLCLWVPISHFRSRHAECVSSQGLLHFVLCLCAYCHAQKLSKHNAHSS